MSGPSPTERPLLGLTMIVKDEAPCIRKTIDSTKGVVDVWTILDTGSTDGTQQVVRGASSDAAYGALHEEPFVDYATSRNRALELHESGAGPAVFALSLSADETLVGGEALRAFLEERRDAPDGAYCIEMRSGDKRWFYPRVLRVGAGWKYVGEVHEVPRGPNGETHGPLVPGVSIIYAATDPERHKRRVTDFDLPRLLLAAEDATRPIEERAQAIWFLGQTYEEIAQATERTSGGPWISLKLAAMSYYWRRSEIGHEDVLKSHYAIFRYLAVGASVGFWTLDELLVKLSAVVDMEPDLAEARYLLAAYAAKKDPREGLFFAEEAARVSREALEAPPLQFPADTRLEWLSLEIAANCAKEIGRGDYAKVLAERAIIAGGPRDRFQAFINYVPPPPECRAEVDPVPAEPQVAEL